MAWWWAKDNDFITWTFFLCLKLNEQVSGMSGIYGSAKVCPFANQKCDVEKEGLGLDPGLESIISRTTNTTWEELIYVWKSWRDASGKKMRDKFIDYIGLTNEVAKANGRHTVFHLGKFPKNDLSCFILCQIFQMQGSSCWCHTPMTWQLMRTFQQTWKNFGKL